MSGDMSGHPLVPAGRGDTISIALLGDPGQPLCGELVAIAAVDVDSAPLALIVGTGDRARTVVPWHAISTMRRDNPGDQEYPF